MRPQSYHGPPLCLLAPHRTFGTGGTCVAFLRKPPGNDCDFGIAPATVLAGKHRKKDENFPENEKDGLQEKLTNHLMARPRGFEPPTYRFVAGHSIR